MFPSPIAPFIIGLITAAWFGFLSYRTHRGLVLWIIGGGCLGLVVSMMCVGLAHAVAVPYSETQVASYYLRGVAVSVLLVGLTSAAISWFVYPWGKSEDLPSATGKP